MCILGYQAGIKTIIPQRWDEPLQHDLEATRKHRFFWWILCPLRRPINKLKPRPSLAASLRAVAHSSDIVHISSFVRTREPLSAMVRWSITGGMIPVFSAKVEALEQIRETAGSVTKCQGTSKRIYVIRKMCGSPVSCFLRRKGLLDINMGH